MFGNAPLLPLAAPLVMKLGPAEVSYSDSRSILTEASGFIGRYDYTLNPYSGCGFGCDYCYARYFAPSEEQRDGWGRWVRVKRNAVALLPEFAGRHPLGPGSHGQGFLSCMYELQEMLRSVTGMQGVSLTPMAGAQGEFAGVAMIQAYHRARGDRL